MVDAERTVADVFLILVGWVNEEQQGVIKTHPSLGSNIGIRRVPKLARSTENDVSEAPRTPAGPSDLRPAEFWNRTR